jgi:hypothetical protein
MFIFRALGALSLIAALGAAFDGTLSNAAAQEGAEFYVLRRPLVSPERNLRPQ